MNRLASSLLAFVAVQAPAHHNSGAVFDLERELVLEGNVSRYEWRNPHIYIYVDAAVGGESAEWRIEAGPLALMRRLGWSSDSLSVGDHVVVTANPSRTAGRTAAFLKSIETSSGVLPPFQREQSVQALETSDAPPQRASDLTGTWVTLLDVATVSTFDDPAPSVLTPAGAVSIAEFDEPTMHPGLECIPFTAPMMMLIPDIKSIERIGSDIRIRSEFDGAERVVRMRDAADGGGSPTLHGRSVGRWRDGTLVIETASFAEHRSGNAFGLASSSAKRLHEELELDDDGTALIYRFVLTDPVYLAEPIVGEIEWAYRPDLTYAAAPCDRENSRRFLED